MKLRPLKNKIIVHNFEKGLRTLNSGIVLLNDDGKEHGIRARWAQIYEVGPKIKYLEKDQWVLIEHGRWTHGLKIEEDLTVYGVDNAAILAVSDEKPIAEIVGHTTDHGFMKER